MHIFSPHEPSIISRAASIFDLCPIASDAIASALSAHPDSDMDGCFQLLLPPNDMLTLDDSVYRHHAHELAERVATGRDTSLMTSAEVMVAVQQASLRAPLNAPHARLFHVLFEEVLGLPSDGIPREDYPGQTDELLAKYKRKRSPR